MAEPLLRRVHEPSAISGQSNGGIPDVLLSTTPGRNGGYAVTLEASCAARAWRVMVAAAAADGIILKISTPINAYRPYSSQLSIWYERYQRRFNWRSPIPRSWNGERWWHWYGATAARPGTSNHGKGCAVDLWLGPGVYTWMAAHAERFGFGMELRSEKWHWIYWVGDAIPSAVIDGFEIAPKPTPPPLHLLLQEREPNMVISNTFNKWRLLILDDGSAIAVNSAGASRVPDACVDERQWDALIASFESRSKLTKIG